MPLMDKGQKWALTSHATPRHAMIDGGNYNKCLFGPQKKGGLNPVMKVSRLPLWSETLVLKHE